MKKRESVKRVMTDPPVAAASTTPTASYQVTPPEPFSFSKPEEWPKWSRRFERFRNASGLNDKPDPTQVNTLIYSMGDQADDILGSFGLSEEESSRYETVKAKFESYFVKKKNVIYERARFNMRVQEKGEAVDEFITALYKLAEHCGYGVLHDEMIRDRIVVGIKNAKLSEKLQLDSTLTLEKAITQVRQSEEIKRQQPLLRGEGDSLPIGSVRGRRGNPGDKSGHGRVPKKQGEGKACGRCGRSPTHDIQHCPARNSTCHKCQKRGHFQSVCRSTGKPHSVRQIQEDSSDDAFLGAVGHSGRNAKPWIVKLRVNGKMVEFQIDTGAEVSVIPRATYRQLGSPPLRTARRRLKGPSSNYLDVRGYFMANVDNTHHRVEQEIYVVDDLFTPLLGQPAIAALGLIRRVMGVQGKTQQTQPNPWVQRFPKLFTGLGKMDHR